MARHYHQGLYRPKNPEKYVGDATNIVFRSSWEKKFLVFADTNPSVLKYSSEEVIVPYFSQIDNKMHRYFPDFIIQIQQLDGAIKMLMIEIKPEAQTLPPKHRNTRQYLNELATYSVNTSKWQAAEQYCKKNNMEFLIMTEQHLGI
jgi:hypothetical protein